MINMLMEREIIRVGCSVKKGKMILEAFSVTNLGVNGTRPGIVAVGVKTINVETWMECYHD